MIWTCSTRRPCADCAASLHRAAGDLLWAPEAHPVLLRAGQSLDDARLTGPAICLLAGHGRHEQQDPGRR